MIAFLLPSQGLKGSDKMLYDLVSSASWACQFSPVVLIEDKKEDVDDDFWDIHDSHFSRNVFAFTKQDFMFLHVSVLLPLCLSLKLCSSQRAMGRYSKHESRKQL
jgi:hypothetical protein